MLRWAGTVCRCEAGKPAQPRISVSHGNPEADGECALTVDSDEMSHPVAPRNQVGVASVILGVVALSTCWLLIGVPLGIAAVLTGDVARRRAQRREADNPRAAVAGIVLGAAAIVAGLVAIGYYAWVDAQKP